MERYIIQCTEEQIKKALELGAPIEDDGSFLSLPTAEEMLGWLEEQYFNEIHVEQNARKTWSYIMYDKKDNCIDEQYGYTTRKEATLAAIDAALEYLTKNKEK